VAAVAVARGRGPADAATLVRTVPPAVPAAAGPVAARRGSAAALAGSLVSSWRLWPSPRSAVLRPGWVAWCRDRSARREAVADAGCSSVCVPCALSPSSQQGSRSIRHPTSWWRRP
jgi:hypothetical protein